MAYKIKPNATIKYRCLCGCIQLRSGVSRHETHGVVTSHRCLKHPSTGIATRKYATCRSCGHDYDVPYSTRHKPCLCPECKIGPKPFYILGGRYGQP